MISFGPILSDGKQILVHLSMCTYEQLLVN